MEKKINIAELLKDCPQGMELYSPLCGKCVFDRLNFGTIICKKQNTQEITFTSEGYYMLPVFDNCECMIFPSKDQRDWSKFQRPFKDGDIVFTTLGNIAIIRKPIGEELFCVYGIMVGNGFYKDETTKVVVARLATEEEKQKLFNAIKSNGYKWNAETKTLDKLIEPKFKVGDRIKQIGSPRCYIIKTIEFDRYVLNNNQFIRFVDEHVYELAPNKFDITTLKPFESRVLVRNSCDGFWMPTFWGIYEAEKANRHLYRNYLTTKGFFLHCIPYNDDTKHLLGKTNDCDEYYKTWE